MGKKQYQKVPVLSVEEVIDRKLERRANNKEVYVYLVKWKGYDYSECSWEPRSNLQCFTIQAQAETIDETYDKKKAEPKWLREARARYVKAMGQQCSSHVYIPPSAGVQTGTPVETPKPTKLKATKNEVSAAKKSNDKTKTVSKKTKRKTAEGTKEEPQPGPSNSRKHDRKTVQGPSKDILTVSVDKLEEEDAPLLIEADDSNQGYFNWNTYLLREKATAAPAECFWKRQPGPFKNHWADQEEKLVRALDPDPDQYWYCVGYIVGVEGPFVKVGYVGAPSDRTRWFLQDDACLRPFKSINEVDISGIRLIRPPSCYTSTRSYEGVYTNFIKNHKKTEEEILAAPDVFDQVSGTEGSAPVNHFEVGQKLETYDASHGPRVFFPATVVKLMKNSMVKIQYDGTSLTRVLPYNDSRLLPCGFAQSIEWICEFYDRSKKAIRRPKSEGSSTQVSPSTLHSISIQTPCGSDTHKESHHHIGNGTLPLRTDSTESAHTLTDKAAVPSIDNSSLVEQKLRGVKRTTESDPDMVSKRKRFSERMRPPILERQIDHVKTEEDEDTVIDEKPDILDEMKSTTTLSLHDGMSSEQGPSNGHNNNQIKSSSAASESPTSKSETTTTSTVSSGGSADVEAFDWPAYLKSENAVAAPAECFWKRPPGPYKTHWRGLFGKLLRAPDANVDQIDWYCVGYIYNVSGPWVQIGYVGGLNDRKRWFLQDDPCLSRFTSTKERGEDGLPLIRPPSFSSGTQLLDTIYTNYVKNQRKTEAELIAPPEAFDQIPNDCAPRKNYFVKGQKLETYEPVNGFGHFFPATVVDVKYTNVTIQYDLSSTQRTLRFNDPRLLPCGYAQSIGSICKLPDGQGPHRKHITRSSKVSDNDAQELTPTTPTAPRTAASAHPLANGGAIASKPAMNGRSVDMARTAVVARPKRKHPSYSIPIKLYFTQECYHGILNRGKWRLLQGGERVGDLGTVWTQLIIDIIGCSPVPHEMADLLPPADFDDEFILPRLYLHLPHGEQRIDAIALPESIEYLDYHIENLVNRFHLCEHAISRTPPPDHVCKGIKEHQYERGLAHVFMNMPVGYGGLMPAKPHEKLTRRYFLELINFDLLSFNDLIIILQCLNLWRTLEKTFRNQKMSARQMSRLTRTQLLQSPYGLSSDQADTLIKYCRRMDTNI